MLQAKAVVLGTNAYTDDLWPGLKKVFTTIHYVQFATKPLGDEATNILPGRQGLWDTGQIMFNVRKDAFNRLLVGTMGRVVGSIDKGFGFLFGIFKGYVVSVCLFSILNWFYPFQNWGISADESFSFNFINRGSEILIKEFPSSEDFIETKEKIEKI